jgi:hypothetical protein
MMYVRRDEWPLVLTDDDGIRPAGEPDQCFYCRSRVGQPHGPDCVCVNKLVEYAVHAHGRRVGTYLRHDPAFWTPHDCESHKNESSWCACNALDEIDWTDEAVRLDAAALTGDESCACPLLEFRFVCVADPGPFVLLRTPVVH